MLEELIDDEFELLVELLPPPPPGELGQPVIKKIIKTKIDIKTPMIFI
jgi:hypothetical protein